MLRKTHTMVDRYRASDFDKEIVPLLSLRDILFICIYYSVTRLFASLVIRKLRMPYLIFNLAVGFLLTRPAGNANYPKRFYHTLWYKLEKLQGDILFRAAEPSEDD